MPNSAPRHEGIRDSGGTVPRILNYMEKSGHLQISAPLRTAEEIPVPTEYGDNWIFSGQTEARTAG